MRKISFTLCLVMLINLILPIMQVEAVDNVPPPGYNPAIGPIERMESQMFNEQEYTGGISYRNLDFLDSNNIFMNGSYYYYRSYDDDDIEKAGRIYQAYNINTGDSSSYRHNSESYYSRASMYNVVFRNPIQYTSSTYGGNTYLNKIINHVESDDYFYSSKRSPSSSFKPEENNEFFNLDNNTFMMTSFIWYTLGNIDHSTGTRKQNTFYIVNRDGNIVAQSDTYTFESPRWENNDTGLDDKSLEFEKSISDPIHVVKEGSYYVIFYAQPQEVENSITIEKKYFTLGMQYVPSMDKEYTFTGENITSIKEVYSKNFATDVNEIIIAYNESGVEKLQFLDFNLNPVKSYSIGSIPLSSSYGATYGGYGLKYIIAGNYMFFNYRSSYYSVSTYILDLDTGTARRVATTDLGGAVKSPDGKWVYFVLDENKSLYRIPNNSHYPVINTFGATGSTIHIEKKNRLSWGASDQDGDTIKYNIKVGNSLGSSDYADAETTNTNFDLDSSGINLTWNATNNRYEKKLYARLTADDQRGKKTTKDISFTLINFKPNIIITTPITAQKIAPGETLTLEVKGWDTHKDGLTASATINGKPRSIPISSSPSSQPASANLALSWNDLPEGQYQNIPITITDQFGGSVQAVWNGTVNINDVLSYINTNIQDHVFPKEYNHQFVISNTDTQITQSARNDSLINSIKNNLDNRKSEDMYFIGLNGTTKSYIQNKLTPEYGITGQDNIPSIIDYIMRIAEKNKNVTVFTVGDNIDNNIIFEDIESDYEGISPTDKLLGNDVLEKEKKNPKADTLQITYTHDPSIFDNPESVHSKSSEEWKIIQDQEDPYLIKKAESTMRGEWTISIKGSDTTRNLNYDKYSDVSTLKLVIQERPFANINSWKESDTQYHYLTAERSKDRDYEKQLPDWGIISYKWLYQLADGKWYIYGDTSKRITIPREISGQEVINFAVTVTDFHNTTDTAISSAPPLLDPEPAILAPNGIYLGEYGSDQLYLTNDTYPKSKVQSYQWLFDFSSISSKYSHSSSTRAGESVTFAKNTLEYTYADKDPFDRNVRLGITLKDTLQYKEAVKPIRFVPVDIKETDLEPLGGRYSRVTTTIKGSNNLDHIVELEYSGSKYNMSYIGNEQWQLDIYTPTSEWIQIKIFNKTDTDIMYDQDQIRSNSPPTITMTKSPNIVYEGDNVRVYLKPEDPDGDPCKVILYLDGDEIFSKDDVASGTVASYTISKNLLTDATKSYELRAVAVDRYNESSPPAIINFSIKELRVDGFVHHTEEWEKNRKQYNKAKSGDENNPRGYDTFFPGEKFILKALTTIIDPERVAEDGLHAESVTVRIAGTTFSITLNNTGSNNWDGSLWDAIMLHWTDRELDFIFTVNYTNNLNEDRQKSDTVRVQIKNDAYWRQHRRF